MCGRYVLVPDEKLLEAFQIQNSLLQLNEIPVSYNIGPGSLEPVVISNSPNRLEIMKWGLIPPWAKDIRIGFKMINARAEGINKKPSFRKPFARQRCLVPANGFYEWKVTPGGKMPYYITIKGSPIFGIAGLYEIAHDGEGREIKSFTIITTEPNSFMAELHNRMPVILKKQDYENWLDKENTDSEKLLHLLKPYDEEMVKHPVSNKVNKMDNQGEDLIYPLK